MADDWAERGGQVAAAYALVQQCGARGSRMSLVADQLQDEKRLALGRVRALVTVEEPGRADARG